MKSEKSLQARRSVLASIGSLSLAVLGGCSDTLARSPETTEQSDVFERIAVEGKYLVIELPPETKVEKMTVIQPNGELFAQRTVPTGVTRESIHLGTNYEPGEYEILGLEEDTTLGNTKIEIRPDIRITDVKLARNHPEEMYEGADDFVVEEEAIVYVKNYGTGPDAITQLRLTGDIPRPTPDGFKESGIQDTADEFSRYADEVLIPPTELKILYSNLLPFLSIGDNVSCEPTTIHGEFTATIQTQIGEKGDSFVQGIEYTGTDLKDCEISLVEDRP